jgi:serine protease Do
MSTLTPAQRWFCVVLIAVALAFLLIFGVPLIAYRIAMAIERGQADGRAVTLDKQLDALSETSKAFRMVSQKVQPSVVHVNVFAAKNLGTTLLDGRPTAVLQPYLRDSGSGVIIDDEGYIVTNHHVISGAAGVEVRLANGERFTAELVGSDQRLDLAVLKIDLPEGVKAATLGDSNQLAVGDWVLAIGNPFGLDQSVTAGIVSAKGRRSLLENFDGEDLIQTDAAINPGNSGGPLVNLKGEVVGINTFIIGEGNLGIGFAIPASTVKVAIEAFKKYGQIDRGWLGLLMHEVTPRTEDQTEAPLWMQVDYTIPGSPAEAVLKPGDLLTHVNGQPFRTSKELREQIEQTKPGETIELGVIRGDQRLTVKLASKITPREPRVLPGEREWKITLAYNVDAVLARQLGLRTTNGILVKEVDPRGPAADVLNPGDLIIAVGETPTPTIGEFADAVRKLPPGDSATLTVHSSRGFRQVELPVPDRA